MKLQVDIGEDLGIALHRRVAKLKESFVLEKRTPDMMTAQEKKEMQALAFHPDRIPAWLEEHGIIPHEAYISHRLPVKIPTLVRALLHLGLAKLTDEELAQAIRERVGS